MGCLNYWKICFHWHDTDTMPKQKNMYKWYFKFIIIFDLSKADRFWTQKLSNIFKILMLLFYPLKEPWVIIVKFLGFKIKYSKTEVKYKQCTVFLYDGRNEVWYYKIARVKWELF